MWATSAGSSAPPTERDRPPNIRWSTNRSPGSPSAKVNSTRVLGASGARRRVEPELAAHPQMGQHGVSVGQREPQVLAPPPGFVDGLADQPVFEVGDPRQMPP